MGYTRGEIPMLDVHGISVSGGSFPAEIWRRFMSPALAGTPVVDFPEPTQPAVFTTWERGPNALSYDPYYVAPETTATETTETTGDGGGSGGKAKAKKSPAGAGR
jgi:membrane peptidoglycan carboxypeptidase